MTKVNLNQIRLSYVSEATLSTLPECTCKPGCEVTSCME